MKERNREHIRLKEKEYGRNIKKERKILRKVE
jgi:hypothetical protein